MRTKKLVEFVHRRSGEVTIDENGDEYIDKESLIAWLKPIGKHDMAGPIQAEVERAEGGGKRKWEHTILSWNGSPL